MASLIVADHASRVISTRKLNCLVENIELEITFSHGYDRV